MYVVLIYSRNAFTVTELRVQMYGSGIEEVHQKGVRCKTPGFDI